jgi:hypothetical protein
MAATNRYSNFSAVGWTPSGGSLVTLTGIKSISYDEGGEALLESAVFDIFNTTGGVNHLEPKITVETLDAFALYATVAGTKGALTFTVRDFTNGATASGGAKVVTVSNAFLVTRPQQNQHRQLSTQTLTFNTTSTDGSTHPVAVTAA